MAMFIAVGMTAVTASVVVAVFLSIMFPDKPTKPSETYEKYMEVKDSTKLTIVEEAQNEIKELRRDLERIRCFIHIVEERNWRSLHEPDN